jgi:hypothetical protein
MSKLLGPNDILNRKEMAGIDKTWKEPEASRSILEQFHFGTVAPETIFLYKYVIDSNNFS